MRRGGRGRWEEGEDEERRRGRWEEGEDEERREGEMGGGRGRWEEGGGDGRREGEMGGGRGREKVRREEGRERVEGDQREGERIATTVQRRRKSSLLRTVPSTPPIPLPQSYTCSMISSDMSFDFWDNIGIRSMFWGALRI